MITVRDLSWQYEPLVDGGKPVDSLKHVSFDIKSGSFVGVIGPTGAGKSTLCMALAGIIPNLADGTMTGLVEVNGMNTSRYSVSALSERIGYVQQDPEAQLFCASVEDEIAFPLENRGIAPDIIDKQIDVMLDLVGMTGYRKRVPTSLSGGQMQRVAIAAALAAEPDVLILDEPTAALDPEGKQEVFDVLERIRQTRSMTVIMRNRTRSISPIGPTKCCSWSMGNWCATATPACSSVKKDCWNPPACRSRTIRCRRSRPYSRAKSIRRTKRISRNGPRTWSSVWTMSPTNMSAAATHRKLWTT